MKKKKKKKSESMRENQWGMGMGENIIKGKELVEREENQ